MIIVANGGYRTGSTLAYMIPQRLFEALSIKFESGVVSHEDILELDDSKNRIIKSHNFMPPNRLKYRTIYTRRNYLDVCSSFVQAGFDLDYNIEIAEEKRRRRLMLELPCLTVDYEDFYENEIYLVRKIAAYLDLVINEKLATEVADMVSIKTIRSIADVLSSENSDSLHPNHVDEKSWPGSYVDVLSTKEIQEIVDRYREF